MIEIACFDASSAITAAKAGASRIELCANYAAGGVTPSLSTLTSIREATTTPINVMVRPRAGDFNYTKEEFAQMKSEIGLFKSSSSGFVFGILNPNHSVDIRRNKELVELAAPLPCTFHRAIDEVPDLDEAVDAIIKCGFKSILTSGGMRTAVEGAERVRLLEGKSGSQITFILGGGVRSTNVEQLKRRTGVQWFHSAAITKPGEEVDEEEVRKLQEVLQS
ncbi:Nn.00g111360.m01.CDS01 [Neocucurbitaria sp. VM-36]